MGGEISAAEGDTSDDEDMTPTDTTIDYKVRLFLHLYSYFGYNSLCSTSICRYLNVGKNVSQSASPSKLNFRFVGSPIVLHWEGHNSSIRSAIEVNEHLMEAFKYIWSHHNITLARPPNYRDILPLFCVGCYGVVTGLLFTLGTQAPVGARPKNMENT
jgi:hypothetical protein